MSSVIGEKKCSKCGGSMFYDFDCRTQEEYRMCSRCGFTQEWKLLRNEDGTAKLELGYGTIRKRSDTAWFC